MNAAPDASVARVIWHPQTNQIICSTSAGAVRVMYDPAISDKGAMLSAERLHSRLNTNMFLPKHAVWATWWRDVLILPVAVLVVHI